ncbi:FAD-dependent monooxygenase [Thauera aromatica]|uniref:2-octaprenyl-6-methoxyphenol hydroxylase n=1 Tax=Thauera aromatica K172 TaxID=44139 RepID=A0A2R4BQ51_THAAR|nr:FAD-dependent monooxygenase [Thauera aromatica]AVR89344.1 2-octaprenyl-6-methoxyphenol hydroxylase [Thauera aromatica K172]MCK2096978.1 FAD-dependent monooxygenase [Thauera aromatica]
MAEGADERVHDLLIVGAGPVGLALALALKDTGLDVVLVDARTRAAVAADPRDLALAHGSRLMLERLGVWEAIPKTAIEHIHVSQQGGLGRTLIDAAEHGLPALGYVVSAGALAAALRATVDAAGITVMDEAEVTGLVPAADAVTARLGGAGRAGATLRARLAACAEGGLRADDPEVVELDYRQDALIAALDVAGGHRHTAFERFTGEGPLALLPRGEGYALVHVVRRESADELLGLDAAAYLAHLQVRLGHRVRLTGVGPRRRYPLQLRYRRAVTGVRTVWLGNAAQTLHPVAGQGFNLALRDVWALADLLLRRGAEATARAVAGTKEAGVKGAGSKGAGSKEAAFDPGCAALLAAYAHARDVDRFGTMRFTDSLVRVFSNDFAPLRHARGAALFALDLLPPLRGFIARRMMFGARAWP